MCMRVEYARRVWAPHCMDETLLTRVIGNLGKHVVRHGLRKCGFEREREREDYDEREREDYR